MLMNRIAVVAGGTLGHINPALSLIKAIKNTNPNAYIIFLATTKDEKYDLVVLIILIIVIKVGKA